MTTDNKQLDELNTKRVETTKKQVAHAIRLVANDADMIKEGHKPLLGEQDFAHAINLLESANQDMHWACEHFNWDTAVCDLIDEAIARLGMVVAELIITVDDIENESLMSYNAFDGITAMGKALATLVRWFDDDQDVSEI